MLGEEWEKLDTEYAKKHEIDLYNYRKKLGKKQKDDVLDEYLMAHPKEGDKIKAKINKMPIVKIINRLSYYVHQSRNKFTTPEIARYLQNIVSFGFIIRLFDTIKNKDKFSVNYEDYKKEFSDQKELDEKFEYWKKELELFAIKLLIVGLLILMGLSIGLHQAKNLTVQLIDKVEEVMNK